MYGTEPATACSRNSVPDGIRTARGRGAVTVLTRALMAFDLAGALRALADRVEAGMRGSERLCGVDGPVDCGVTPTSFTQKSVMTIKSEGTPLVWALHGAGPSSAGRLYGRDFMLGAFALGARSGMRHFLYGNFPEDRSKLEARLLRSFPDARIVGTFAPPRRALTQEEENNIAQMINATEADVVWVGLSTSKQEEWMAHMRARLQATVLIGVGAAIDYNAGNKTSAPNVMKTTVLEWLLGVVSEPLRLWRRHARNLPSQLYAAAMRTGSLPDPVRYLRVVNKPNLPS